MLQVRVRGGGSGRYHSRAVMPAPRPAGVGAAVSPAAAPPRPPRPPRPPAAATSEGAAAGAAAVGASGAPSAPPPPPTPRPPPIVRRIVLAPPLPKVSYMRSMPLWLELM